MRLEKRPTVLFSVLALAWCWRDHQVAQQYCAEWYGYG
jgi:hypothetical protein